MSTSSVSSKGQVTIPKAVREHLRVEPGSAVEFVIAPDGTVVLRKYHESARPLRGALRQFAPATPLSIEAMDAALADAVVQQEDA